MIVPGLQRRDDARLEDRDRLLLHRLVYGSPVRVVHFVELIDEAGTFVGEDRRAALERPLPRNNIFAAPAVRPTSVCSPLDALAEEGEGDGSLDILVTVNAGSDRFDDTLERALLSRPPE